MNTRAKKELQKLERRIRVLMSELRARVTDEDYRRILDLEALLNQRTCLLIDREETKGLAADRRSR